MNSGHRHHSHRVNRRMLLHVLAVLFLISAESCWSDCTVSAVAVIFGSYDVFSAANLDGAGTVDVSCSPGASYTIDLSTGGGSYDPRQMNSGANLLDYNLYTSATRSVIWGDGTGATASVNGSGTDVSYTVYGRVPALQNKAAGNYSDTLTVTLTF